MVDKTLFFRRIKFIFWIIVYYSIVVYYGHYIEEEFDRVRGFQKVAFNINYYILNLIPVFAYSVLFPLRMKYVSDYIVFFMILLINIPIGYFCLLKTDSYLLSLGVVALNFSWFLLWIMTRHIFVKIPKIKFRLSLKRLVFIFIFLTIIIFILTNGISIQFYEKGEIYKVRKLFKTRDMNIILRYLFTLMQYSLIPLVIMIAIRIKSNLLKIIYISIAVIMALSIFSATALKSSLFVVIFVLIGYLISRFRVFNPNILLFLLSAFVFSLSYVYESGAILTELYDHTLRRVLYIPSKTSVLAYEYFTENCSDCGLFNGVGGNTGNILSEYYFGTKGNSTTGFLAKATLNKGLLYALLMIVLLVISLKAIDTITRHLPIKYGLVVFIVYGYVLSNTALSTTLVSYGLILSLLIVRLLRKWIRKIE